MYVFKIISLRISLGGNMARFDKENTIVSIDIGTTKICVLIAQKMGDQMI